MSAETTVTSSSTIALVVRAGPYAQRSPRAQLDVALASAALEQPLEIYFLGEAILQLTGSQRPGAANLPRGLKGWAALPQLGEAGVFADKDARLLLNRKKQPLTIDVGFLEDQEILERWSKCRHLLAL